MVNFDPRGQGEGEKYGGMWAFSHLSVDNTRGVSKALEKRKKNKARGFKACYLLLGVNFSKKLGGGGRGKRSRV